MKWKKCANFFGKLFFIFEVAAFIWNVVRCTKRFPNPNLRQLHSTLFVQFRPRIVRCHFISCKLRKDCFVLSLPKDFLMPVLQKWRPITSCVLLRMQEFEQKNISLLNSTSNFANEYYECSTGIQQYSQQPTWSIKTKFEFIRNERRAKAKK